MLSNSWMVFSTDESCFPVVDHFATAEVRKGFYIFYSINDESNAKNAMSAIDIHLNVGPRLGAGHGTIYLKIGFNFLRFLHETTCYRAAWPQGRTHRCC